jgi:hypothetical protein
MKTRFITARNFYSLFAALLILSVAGSADAAEKKSVTLNTKWGSVQQRIAVPIGDRAGHDIGAQVRQDASSSTDPDWDNATAMVIGQFDVVKGNGAVWGYAVRTVKSGDKVFLKYDGTTKRSGEGDQWQSVGEGTVEVYGGTGKFAGIKGTGTFKSENSPAGGGSTVILEVEY